MGKTGGGIAGKAPKYGGKTKSGLTFGVVELLDPSDSNYFRGEMRRKGFRELTPPVSGNSFRSKPPTEEWMKKVANLDPDWWYISGHFAAGEFFNEPYYRNDYRARIQHLLNHVLPNPNSWKIQMRYYKSRAELKNSNFFEKYGPPVSSGFPSYHAKIVLTVACNTLVDPWVRMELFQLFPKAIVLGHIAKNPANATHIVANFLRKYFAKPEKAGDWKHIVSSWLSYHDLVKSSIEKRGYGLAAMHERNILGIDVDKSYPRVVGRYPEMVERFRLRSVSRPGRKIDVLLANDMRGESKVVSHEGMYEGDKQITYFDLVDPDYHPNIFHLNRNNNRGY